MNQTSEMPLNEAYWFQEGPGVRNWQFTTSGIKLLNVANVTKLGELDLNRTDRYLSIEEVDNKYSHFLIEPGDLVIASSGISFDSDGLLRTRGAFVRKNNLPLCLNTSTIRFKAKKDVSDLRFLKFWLDSDEFRKQITQRVTGSAQQNFGPSHLESLQIRLPPLPEQKRIAAILEKADRLRRMRRYARQLSDTFLQSVFLEMFGDPASTSANFDKVTFDDVVDSTQLGLVRGSGEMNDSFPFAYIRMDSIIGNGTLQLSPVKHVKASPAEAIQFALKGGDFLFNTRNSRELVGKTALFFGEGTYLFNNNILRVRFKTSADPRYMIQLFQTNWMKQNLERVKSGTTNVFAVYYKDLRDLPVLLPPLVLQQKFAAIVQRFERLRAQQREAERQAEHLFQTLLHRAFTVEIND